MDLVMNVKNKKFILLVATTALFSSCDLMEKIESRAEVINNYERSALVLAKENRELKMEIERLRFEIQGLKSTNNFLKLKLDDKQKEEKGRGLASVAPVAPQNDLVKYDIYKWSPNQILATAETAFKKQDFEKAAQFFHALAVHYPEHKEINDKYLFQAGVSAFESGEHPEWVIAHLDRLVKEYPASKFYRGARLWAALTHLKQGNSDQFFDTVEEFRLKYRNTDEWKILSGHYEKIVQKYKK
tara:strand:+ start:121517 stop:122245 length:729 start_codon:yes stop_codon:yes gene_type:complete